MSDRITRREAVLGTGALGLSALLAGCGLDGGGDPASTTVGTAGDGSAATTEFTGCVLTPEQTEGPYYLADSMIRSDITDGREGVPLELRLRVQAADSCEPIEGATVEVWHADAQGVYSGFDEGEGETFLRGGQRSDSDGKVTFHTIYPGWYQGRTTHIHLKVHAAGDEVHAGQLYFDDSITAGVGESSDLYSSRGAPDTTNASDGIYSSGGEQSTLALERDGDRYVGSLALGVRV